MGAVSQFLNYDTAPFPETPMQNQRPDAPNHPSFIGVFLDVSKKKLNFVYAKD